MNLAGTDGSIGTGFMLAVPDPRTETHAFLYLISNKHVYKQPACKLQLTFTRRNTSTGKPVIGDLVTFEVENFTHLYHEHPDKSIDLACINASDFGNKADIYAPHLHDGFLLTQPTQDFGAGDKVYFVGYPENRYDIKNNLPLMRTGHVASIPEIDYDGKKQFIVDAQVFPGSSGSPVFATVDGKTKIVGVVTETMIKHGKLEVVPTVGSAVVTQILGLGIVLKASLVVELIKHATIKLAALPIASLKSGASPEQAS